MNKKQYIAFIFILTLAALLRFTGLNWDAGSHLHPDERFLTMVATNLRWPTSLPQYFDTDHSPINPHNKGFNFYVYGTWPIILVKAVAQTLGRDSYDGIPMVGRSLAALADLVTLIFVFLITKHLVLRNNPPSQNASDGRGEVTNQRTYAPLLAMFLYGISVLPIQLSHFFAVDPFATVFLTMAMYQMVRKQNGALLGLTAGLAIAAKISSVLIIPIIALSILSNLSWKPIRHIVSKKNINICFHALLCLGVLFLTIRIAYPYLFVGYHLNPQVLANWRELKAFDGDQTGFPPALQWISTIPIVYPLVDLVIWGLGLPLGILTIVAILSTLWQTIRARRLGPMAILLCWTLIVFGYQSIQFAKPLRYMAPIYPALAVLTGLFLSRMLHFFSSRFSYRSIGQLVNWSICLSCLLWPLAFTSVYHHPPTRVTASEWIYNHVPSESTISWETWDDPLPLGLAGNQISQYHTIPLALYDPDTDIKWQKLSTDLARTDFLILSSNRVYGGIERAKTRFPVSTRYYERLFDGTLGFEKVAEFTSRPTLPIPFASLCILPPTHHYSALALPGTRCSAHGLEIIDDFAEESFTVYDHPKVTLFRNSRKLTGNELFRRIMTP